jgi:hypothetical protein
MITEIYVCLDLGNDTLKISFAHKCTDKEARGKEVYGKLNVPDLLNQVAYPAAAFYDTEANKWLFAEELESGENTNFSTVVKIKEMLSLIVSHENADIERRNSQYYKGGHFFPKFSFPIRRKIGRDFQYLVDNKLVFQVPSYTPRKMCEEFFMHIKEQITKRISDYSSATGILFKPLTKIAIVHPSKLGEEYVAELCRLIKYTVKNGCFEAFSWIMAILQEEFEQPEGTGMKDFSCELGRSIPHYNEFTRFLQVDFNAIRNDRNFCNIYNNPVNSIFWLLLVIYIQQSKKQIKTAKTYS